MDIKFILNRGIDPMLAHLSIKNRRITCIDSLN